jgi:hypothetical protein
MPRASSPKTSKVGRSQRSSSQADLKLEGRTSPSGPAKSAQSQSDMDLIYNQCREDELAAERGDLSWTEQRRRLLHRVGLL